MPRKSFLVRHTRPPVPDRQSAAKYLLHWTAGDLYSQPDAFPEITSESLFGNNAPLELEIGCGTGEYLCGLAEHNPTHNFIGLDTSLKSLYTAVEKARSLSLHNIRFIRASIQYIFHLMPPSSLQAVYLHFPDPLLRPKYRKRQIFTDELLHHIHQALVSGGHLSIVTDNQELFSNILTLLENDPRFTRTHTERYLVGFDPPIKSRYQLYWESHDVPILRLYLAKADS